MEKKARMKKIGKRKRGRVIQVRTAINVLFPRQPKVPLSVRQERNSRQRLKFWKTYHDKLFAVED